LYLFLSRLTEKVRPSRPVAFGDTSRRAAPMKKQSLSLLPTAKSSSLYTREPFTPPHVNPQCSHTALFERGARIEIESDGTFGKEEKSGNIIID